MKVFSNSLKPTRDNQFNLLLIILVAGTILRIFHFLDNRSLWEDEVFLASSLVKMNFHELAYSTLDYQQRAPIGFLWLVRLSVILFGNHEMPLRLVSLISGVSGLFLFVPVARYFLQNYALPAVFIVAFGVPFRRAKAIWCRVFHNGFITICIYKMLSKAFPMGVIPWRFNRCFCLMVFIFILIRFGGNCDCRFCPHLVAKRLEDVFSLSHTIFVMAC